MQNAKALPTVIPEKPVNWANGETLVDRERLRYITRILGSRQGLYEVCLGTIFFLTELGRQQTWNVPGGWLIELSVLILFIAANRNWIPRYYRKRFGNVEAQGPSARLFALFLALMIALFFFGQPVARHPDPMFSSFVGRLHATLSDSSRQINLSPPFLWMAVFVSSLRWPLRRMEGRWLLFLLWGALASTSIALFPMWYPGTEKLALWKVSNAGGVGLTFIAMGLYDHIALVLLLPKRAAEGDDE